MFEPGLPLCSKGSGEVLMFAASLLYLKCLNLVHVCAQKVKEDLLMFAASVLYLNGRNTQTLTLNKAYYLSAQKEPKQWHVRDFLALLYIFQIQLWILCSIFLKLGLHTKCLARPCSARTLKIFKVQLWILYSMYFKDSGETPDVCCVLVQILAPNEFFLLSA